MFFSDNKINLIQQNSQKTIFSDTNPISFQKGGIKIKTAFKKVIGDSCNSCYSFKVGSYNLQEDLIIDPYWIVNETNNQMPSSNLVRANGIQIDSNGNVFILGQYVVNNTFSNIFIVKYSSSGVFITKTIIGGAHIEIGDHGELGKSIAIDPSDNIYITGYTLNATTGRYDAILVKLNDNLTILSQTVFGGSNDEKGRVIALFNNELFLSGETNSTNITMKNPLDGKYHGGLNDIFIAKFDLNLNLIFSTYFGGSADDEVHAIAVDGLGNLVLTGSTTSTDFNQTIKSWQNGIGSINSPDAFISKISNNGTSIIFSSFFGGLRMDEGNGIDFDSINDIFIIGDSESSQLPFTGTQPTPFNIGSTSLSKIFILGLKPDGYQLPRYYIFDGDSQDYGSKIKIEQNGNIVIAGNSYSSNFWNYNTNTSVYSNGTSKLSRSFITEVTPNGVITGINSKINEICNVIVCYQYTQDFLINKENFIYLLTNNYYLSSNSIDYDWIPYLIKISNSSDTTKPQVSIKDYQSDKKFNPNSTITLEVMDDISGIKEVEYKWDNGSFSNINYPYIIRLPSKIGTYVLYITAIDNAGNIENSPFSFTITKQAQDLTNIIILIGSIALSILFGYLTIYFFWKYYFSKKKLTRQLHDDDVKSYIKLVSKDPDLFEEINNPKK